MTNSAGFTGATPIRQISRPLSKSSWVIVVRSHLTKNASSCVVPISAPLRHTVRRKLVIDVRTAIHVGSELGSKTAHCVPRSIDCSRKMNSRRTLMYFHIASDDIVRAPQTRMSRPSERKSRMTLTPARVQDVVLALGQRAAERLAMPPFRSRLRMPRTTSLAGALWTPRSMSDAGVDAGDVAGGRHQPVPFGRVRRDARGATGSRGRRSCCRDGGRRPAGRRESVGSSRMAKRSLVASQASSSRVGPAWR